MSRNIAARIIGSITAVLLGGTMILELPRVQSKVADIVLSRLEKVTDGEISCSSINIRPFNTLVIKDLLILDKHPYTEDIYCRGWAVADTLVHVGRLSASLSLSGLISGKVLHLGRVRLRDADFHLVTEPSENGKAKSNIQRIFRLPEPNPPDTPVAGPDIFDMRLLEAEGLRFRLTSFLPGKGKYSGRGINYEDLDVRASLKAESLKFGGGIMSAEVKTLKLQEKTGYRAEVKGNVSVGMGRTMITDLEIKDRWSEVKLPLFSMSYRNSRALQHFVDEVCFDGRIRNSTVAYETIQAFAYQLPFCKLLTEIKEADVTGPVNDLNVRKFIFKDKNSGVAGNLSCRIQDVAAKRKIGEAPDFGLEGNIRQFNFTSESISTFLRYFAPKLDFSSIASGQRLSFTGGCSGSLCKLNAYGTITTENGSAGTSLQLRNIAVRGKDIEIDGNIFADGLNIGAMTGIKGLGDCTMEASVRSSLHPGNPEFTVDSLDISSLRALDYTYSGLRIDGKFADNKAEGGIRCNDPNIRFSLKGAFGIPVKSKLSAAKIYADISYADLHAIKLDKRGEVSKVSGRLSGDFLNNGVENTRGGLHIKDIVLENDGGVNDIGDIEILFDDKPDKHRIKLSSDFADASYTGENPVTKFLNDLQAVSTSQHIPALYSEKTKTSPFSGKESEIRMRFHDSRKLMSFVMPGLYVADSTDFILGIDRSGKLGGHIISPRLALRKDYIKNADISVDNIDDKVSLKLGNEELKVAGILLKNGVINTEVQEDSAQVNIRYDSPMGEDNHGELRFNSKFSRRTPDSLQVDVHVVPSEIRTLGYRFNLLESDIRFCNGDFDIDSLKATFNDREILVNGGAGRTKDDSLNVRIDGIPLGLISSLTGKDYDMDGYLTGEGRLVSPIAEGMQASMHVGLDSLRMSGKSYGPITLDAELDSTGKAFLIAMNGTDANEDEPELQGTLDTKNKDICLQANFERFDIGLIQPFLAGMFSDMDGHINGKADVSGPLDSLRFRSSDTSFEDITAKIAFTNVPYTINGPFKLDENIISLNDISISDRLGGTGRVNGTVTLDKSLGPVLDAEVRTNRLEALNIPEGKASNISGNISARCDVKVSGPVNNLLIEGSAGTSGNGNIHLSTGVATAVKTNELLSFKEKEKYIDPYEVMIAELPKKKSSGNMKLKLKASVTSATQAAITLDKATGNGITANGSGLIGIDLETKSGNMSVTGDYSIENGKFHFEIPGIVNKDFSIRKGSSIKLNGDVMDSDLDIHAIYNMKTSLSTLLADTTASSRRPVECIINISDKIRNPKINFDINVNDLDPGTKTQVEAALNTDEKIQKQFISLLVMGSFLPDEQSGVFNSSNILYSNVSEIMSGQLNNIFQKLGIPVDLGLGYQQSNTGQNMFDVAISTQLFNNRVLVDGTVGNRQYKTTGMTDNVVGDINIEVKLDKPGTLRFKMFSHSADEHTSFIDYSQRNGIGISAQKEFDTFGELIRSLFGGKRKKTSQRK